MPSRKVTFNETCPKCGKSAKFQMTLYTNIGSGDSKCSECKKRVRISYEGDNLTKIS